MRSAKFKSRIHSATVFSHGVGHLPLFKTGVEEKTENTATNKKRQSEKGKLSVLEKGS
jgi:hypothetical protein